jgi:DNA-binding NarL/FixJ family response regulator
MSDSEPIRVLIVDDEEDSRVLLSDLLSDQPEVEVVGAAQTVEEAVELVGLMRPRVAIIDWMMPGGGGAKAANHIVAAGPEIRVLGISGGDPTQASYEMMQGGATGFISKGCDAQELLDAIRSITRW